MKKYLKLLSIFLVSIAVVFIGVSNVEADDCSSYPSATVGGEKYTITGTSYHSCARKEKKDSKKRFLYQIDSGTAANPKMVIKNGSATITDVSFWRHDWSEESSLSGAVYCLNADLLSFDNLYASRFSFYGLESLKPSNPTDPSYAYDVAILHVLKNGSAGNFEQYFATSLAIRAVSAMFGYIESDSIANTNLEKAYYGQTYNWVTYDTTVKASYDLLKGGLVQDSSFGDALAGYSSYKFEAKSSGAQATLDSAKNLVAGALAATVEHLQNASAGSETDVEVTTTPGPIEEEERAEGLYVMQDIKHSFLFKKFNSLETPEFFIDSLTYNSDYGTDGEPKVVEIWVGGIPVCSSEEHCASILSLNLLDGHEVLENYQVDIVVRVGGYKTVNEGYSVPKIKCGEQPLEYTLNYHHSGGGTTSAYEGDLFIVWRNVSDTDIKQKFISLLSTAEISETDPEDVPGTVEFSTTLIEECDCEYLWDTCKATNDITSEECQEYLYNCDDCEFLEEVCRESEDLESLECQIFFEEDCDDCEFLEEICRESADLESLACQKYFEEDCDDCEVLKVQCDLGMEEACITYEEECEIPPAECNTEHTDTTNCCDDANDLIISLEDKVKYEIHGNIESEIKNCFVDQVDAGADEVLDDVGNSYQMLTDDRVTSNKYCKVHCREDYIMNLPAAKRVNAGRYFTFQASMEATKQCFTNTIDKQAYIDDINRILKDIEENFNGYQEWKKAEEANPHSDPPGPALQDTDCTAGDGGPCVYTQSVIEIGAHTDSYTAVQVEFDIDEHRGELLDVIYSEPTFVQGDVTPKKVCATYTDTVPCDSNPSGCVVTIECICWDAEHEYGLDDLEAEIAANIAAYYAAYTAAVEELRITIEMYKGCSTWETEYEPDPEVTYDYDEEYSGLVPMPTDMEEEINNTPTDYGYCLELWDNRDSVSVNDTYRSCIGGSGFGGDRTININYVKCDLGAATCDLDPKVVSESIYKKSNSESTMSYKPKSLFYNIYPSGKISVEGKMSIEEEDNSVLLKEKLPVALDTKKGIYNYTLEISNIGEYYNDGTQGRFVGGSSPIIENLIYICSYLVNIPDSNFKCDADGNPPKCEGPECDSDCLGPNCEDLYCEGIDCVSDCVGDGCIYDRESGLSLYEKEVSVYELFPEGTKSYNWGNGKPAANEKANTTIEEIETAGTSIYKQEPILSITITPTGTRAIRNYNDEAEDNGGYSNATLRCRNVGSYEKVGCYSSFIDDVIAGDYGTVNSNSTILDERTGTDTGDGGYFKLWPGTISEEEMVGPSWQ